MKSAIFRLFLCGALTIGLALPLSGALAQEQAAAQEPDPYGTREQIRESYVERVRAQGDFLELSLNDAIRLALTNNLDIAIQNYNEQLNRQSIIQAKGAYDPTLSFSVGINSSSNPNTSVLDAGEGIDVSTRDGFTWDTTYNHPLKFGGRLTLSMNNSRSSSNNAFSTLNPSYDSRFNISFTQPLWRGFINTSTERSIKLSNLDLEISDIDFEKRVSEIVRSVRDRYWDLVLSIQTHDAERRSMNLAIVSYEDSKKRVEIGIEAPIEITSSRSEVASREQVMIQSEVGIVDAEADLKNLLAPDPTASIWDLRLIPTDTPQLTAPTFTLPDAIEAAVQNRPEIQSYMKQLEKLEIDRKFYKREGKPTVDLVLRYGSTAVAGEAFGRTVIDTDNDGIPDTTVNLPNPTSPFQGNLGNSLVDAFKFNFTNYSIAANVTIPLRNRSNGANLARVNIDEQRMRSQLRQTHQTIAVEVRKAYQQIEIQKKRLEAARISRQLAEEQLDGENKRFQAGLSTNFEVLRIQRDVATTRKDELAAEIAYVKALTALEQAMYTLIENSDIAVAKNQSQKTTS